MNELGSEWLQFGSFGLLSMILVLGGRIAASFLTRVADRITASADRLDSTLTALVSSLSAHELASVQRQKETLCALDSAERKGD